VELEDALACDDEVLEEVFQFVDPPLYSVIRVPQMFMAQLRHELGWFLQLVYDYGIPVFYWTHHQFADVVRKRYLLRYIRHLVQSRCMYVSANKTFVGPWTSMNVCLKVGFGLKGSGG